MPRECLVGRENQKASREQNEEKEERKAEKKRGGPVRSENINSFQFDCPVPSPVFPTSSLNFRGLGTLHALSLAYDVRKPDLLWIAVDCCGLEEFASRVGHRTQRGAGPLHEFALPLICTGISQCVRVPRCKLVQLASACKSNAHDRSQYIELCAIGRATKEDPPVSKAAHSREHTDAFAKVSSSVRRYSE